MVLMYTPTFTDFFVDNLVFFIAGGCIVAAGLIGALLYVRQQGEEESLK
jgi:hypothetical protein